MFSKFPNYKQIESKDCGAACLKIILAYNRLYYPLSFLKNKLVVTREGVSLKSICDLAEELGFRTRRIKLSTSMLYSKEVKFPVIAHWNNNHFVVIYKVSKMRVFVSDPAIGKVSYNLREFRDKFDPQSIGGAIILLDPSPALKDFSPIPDSEVSINKKRNIKNFFSILKYFHPFKGKFVTVIGVMLFVTILQAILPFISKSVIDVGINTQDVDFIQLILIGNVTIGVCVIIGNLIRDWIMMNIASRINISLLTDYIIKLTKLPITFFESRMLGDILQRANDHERIRSFIMGNSLNLIFSSITFITFGIILFIFQPMIFYVFIVGSSIYVGWVLGFMKLRKKIDYNYFELIAKNQSMWIEMISGMTELKINNYEQTKRWQWENVQAKLFKLNIKNLAINNFQTNGAQIIELLKNISITYVCARGVIEGSITFGVMISVQFIIGMLNAPVQQFIQFVVAAQFAQISFQRLQEINIHENEQSEIIPDVQLNGPIEIYLQNVSFQYHPASPIVIKNVNLVVPKGKITAIVGGSGSGKTTLLKLLLRLYKPTSGDFFLNDINVNNIKLSSWRAKCGTVLQDGKMFNDTIQSNIILDADFDLEKLSNVIEAACLKFDINQMPKGVNTLIGEEGRGLSTGQKQRVLIARALYKDAQVLFLDEATNSLDSINEQKIIKAIESKFNDKTIVMVAHRLSTIRMADQIVVMHSGTIAEIGNHEQLLERKGKYFNLIKHQI